jgi:hypothetical protein
MSQSNGGVSGQWPRRFGQEVAVMRRFTHRDGITSHAVGYHGVVVSGGRGHVALCLIAVTVVVAFGLISACGGTSASDGDVSKTGRGASRLESGQPGLTHAERTFARGTVAMYERTLSEMVRRRQFVAGVWHPSEPCWRCGTEIGTVAAMLARETGSTTYLSEAIATFDTTLARHREPNGSFGPPATGDHFSTEAEVVTMGTAYLELRALLPSRLRAAWKRDISAAAAQVEPNLDFYVNGNVNLQETLAMYVAWLVTKSPRFLADYDQSWAFTLAPGPGWPGYGIHYTRVPTKRSGVNGAGYLAEGDGVGLPGYDAHYTLLQQDYVAELYALSRQNRVLRLLNLLFNQVRPGIDPHNMSISYGPGSRHPSGAVALFGSPSLPVLAFADRPDLLWLVPRQLKRLTLDFTSYPKSDDVQDQPIGNYVAALVDLDPLGQSSRNRSR